MDILQAATFLEVFNGKDAEVAERKLGDLKDEAQHLEKKGIHVKSWREFDKELPQKKPNYFRNAAIGAGIGAAVLGALPLAVTGMAGAAAYGLISGALFGGMLGGYHETENSQRKAKVEAYEKYLKFAEDHQNIMQQLQTMPRGAAPDLLNILAPASTVRPESIAANAVQTKEKACGCGH